MAHICALRGIDNLRINGLRIAAGIVRVIMQLAAIDDDDIGLFAAFQAAAARIQAERARAMDRGHLQHLPGGQRSGIAALRFRQECGQAHLFEHIQVVIAGGAIGAQGDGNAGFQHGGDGGDA